MKTGAPLTPRADVLTRQLPPRLISHLALVPMCRTPCHDSCDVPGSSILLATGRAIMRTDSIRSAPPPPLTDPANVPRPVCHSSLSVNLRRQAKGFHREADVSLRPDKTRTSSADGGSTMGFVLYHGHATGSSCAGCADKSVASVWNTCEYRAAQSRRTSFSPQTCPPVDVPVVLVGWDSRERRSPTAESARRRRKPREPLPFELSIRTAR